METNFTPDAYTTNNINELECKIAKLTAELYYNKAWLFLDNLANTQKVFLVDYLAKHYGVNEVNVFNSEDFRRGQNCTKIVKTAISNYKSKADTKKNPTWANEALKMAKIVDDYKTE
jgi:hypothetical protein